MACADVGSPGEGRSRSLQDQHGWRIAEIPLGGTPDGVGVGPDRVWVTLPGSVREQPPEPGWLLEVDPAREVVVGRIRTGPWPRQVLQAGGAVWVLNAYARYREIEPTLMRIDPLRAQVTAVIPVGLANLDMDADPSGIWLAGGLGDLSRVDFDAPERVVAVRRSGPGSVLDVSALAVGEGSIWLLEGNLGRSLPAAVHRLDPSTGRSVAVVATDFHATDIAVGRGAIWVVNGRPAERNGTLSRIDPRGTSPAGAIPVGPRPLFLAVCDDGVWVSNGSEISRIDPETDRVTDVLAVPFASRKLACGHGSLWATRETPDPREGSLLRIRR